MNGAPPRRGGVYAARLDPVEGSEQGGTRPVVVVSHDDFNAAMPIVTVVPCTGYRGPRRIYSSEVLLTRGTGGLRLDSLVMCHQIRTASRTRLGRKLGSLDATAMSAIAAGLRAHLEL